MAKYAGYILSALVGAERGVIMYAYPFISADEDLKRAVWNKGRVIPKYDATVWRHDARGKVMNYAEHGNTDSEHGWEIDHDLPIAHGGTGDLANLQPLQWENNREKGDSYPWP